MHKASAAVPDMLETGRLVLRRPVAADVPAIARLANDPTIAAQTAGIRYPYAPIDGHRFVNLVAPPRSERDIGAYLIALRSNPAVVVGCAGVHLKPATGYELGYWVARRFRGKGYATEASRALLRIAFGNMQADQVFISCRVGNAASEKVIRRLGAQFVRRGHCFSRRWGRKMPVWDFVLSRRDWERNAGNTMSAAV